MPSPHHHLLYHIHPLKLQLLLSFSRVTVIEEQNVRLKLTITDTPGFGDQINNDKWSVNACLFANMCDCSYPVAACTALVL